MTPSRAKPSRSNRASERGLCEYNCNGNELDKLDPHNIGVWISPDPQAASGTPLRVTVQNCNIDNFFHGVRIHNAMDDRTNGEANFVHSPEVTLSNVHVKNSLATGIHVDRFVQGVLVTGSRVENSAATGIYFSYSTRENRVELSRIFLNGRRAVPGDNRCNSTPREGMALDGSSNNEIVYNDFDGNAAGGIFLHRNCGENSSRVRPPTVGNLIFRNTFRNSPRGVWVAARQSDNLSRLQCDPVPTDASAPTEPYAFVDPGDGSCDEPKKGCGSTPCQWTVAVPVDPNCECVIAPDGTCTPAPGCETAERTGAYYEDHVTDTTLSKNVFFAPTAYAPVECCGSDPNGKHCLAPAAALHVEDDDTLVWKNAFVGYQGGELIRIGTPLRYYHKGQPVSSVVLDGNGYLEMSEATFNAHVRYEFGSQHAAYNPAPSRTERACRQDGVVVPPHSSATFYATQTAPPGEECVAEERMCRRGVLSGSFPFATCEESDTP